jgi:uncharacterized protein YodC (DUF2158 family)
MISFEQVRRTAGCSGRRTEIMTTRGTFKPGDVVRLKSNLDQVMTVAEVIVDFPNEPPWYECHWRAGGKWHEGRFAEHDLERNGQRARRETRAIRI